MYTGQNSLVDDYLNPYHLSAQNILRQVLKERFGADCLKELC